MITKQFRFEVVFPTCSSSPSLPQHLCNPAVSAASCNVALVLVVPFRVYLRPMTFEYYFPPLVALNGAKVLRTASLSGARVYLADCGERCVERSVLTPCHRAVKATWLIVTRDQ